LSVPQFDIITDHRPLLGIERKLDLDGLDPMFTVWRERTEQFRSRRNLSTLTVNAIFRTFGPDCSHGPRSTLTTK
ncbi:MAG: hypothetical protein AAGM67_08870, partial [Bacteroidota bacterium]